MRFGKRLALCVADAEDKPFISHKQWREAIIKAVHEVRAGGNPQILHSLDEELLQLFEIDKESIERYNRFIEGELEAQVEHIMSQSVELGMQPEGGIVELASELSSALSSTSPLFLNCFSEDIRSLWSKLAGKVSETCNGYNDVAWKFQLHLNWLEVNVAGFRKTIKQRCKQVPCQPSASSHRYIGYLELVNGSMLLNAKIAVLRALLSPVLAHFAPGAVLFTPVVGAEISEAHSKFIEKDFKWMSNQGKLTEQSDSFSLYSTSPTLCTPSPSPTPEDDSVFKFGHSVALSDFYKRMT